MTLVDDFGRYDGRARLIHGEVFALRNDVKPQQTAAALQELHDKALILLYQFEGKEYLQILRWQERSRSDKSKFPDPPQESAAERSVPQEKDASLAIAITSSPASIASGPNGSGEPSGVTAIKLNGKDGLTDSEWVVRISKEGAYSGIDVNREHAKMCQWCKVNNRTPTRRRFINWLNRTDKPLTNATNNRTSTESGRGIGTANEGKSAQYKGVGQIR